jgi:hypothetical protein
MGFSPNELMMDCKLRAPNELLRTNGVSQVGGVCGVPAKARGAYV